MYVNSGFGKLLVRLGIVRAYTDGTHCIIRLSRLHPGTYAFVLFALTAGFVFCAFSRTESYQDLLSELREFFDYRSIPPYYRRMKTREMLED